MTGPGRMRFELAVAHGDDAAAEAGRLVALGATGVRPGRGDGALAVLADPDGREFSLLPGP